MTSDEYRAALHDAMVRLTCGEYDEALQRLLTLNAAYFLGEWLPARSHTRLVRRLAAQLDGLANLPLPVDKSAALQLAQHARELAAAFGPTPWTERIVALTADLVPMAPEDWNTQMRAAIHLLRANGNGHPLLRAHARRRLWELTHLDTAPAEAAPMPPWALRYARRTEAGNDGHAIQVAEALLAELAYGAGVGPTPPTPLPKDA